MKVLELAPELNPSPLVTDFDLLWRNKPLAVKTQPVNPRPYGRDDQWTIRIDSMGFRGPERPLPTPHDGTYRILCVGDSITFGFSVDQDAPFARRLEELLRARYPSRPIEVVNAGVPGWSWVQGRRFLEREGLVLRPDLVIVGHGTNDQFFTARITDRERVARLENPIIRDVPGADQYLPSPRVARAPSRRADEEQPRLRGADQGDRQLPSLVSCGDRGVGARDPPADGGGGRRSPRAQRRLHGNRRGARLARRGREGRHPLRGSRPALSRAARRGRGRARREDGAGACGRRESRGVVRCAPRRAARPGTGAPVAGIGAGAILLQRAVPAERADVRRRHAWRRGRGRRRVLRRGHGAGRRGGLRLQVLPGRDTRVRAPSTDAVHPGHAPAAPRRRRDRTGCRLRRPRPHGGAHAPERTRPRGHHARAGGGDREAPIVRAVHARRPRLRWRSGSCASRPSRWRRSPSTRSSTTISATTTSSVSSESSTTRRCGSCWSRRAVICSSCGMRCSGSSSSSSGRAPSTTSRRSCSRTS
ncbi:MAG: SGNH/GDSL hydrolase family protein [Deltaproteobacteria bacterium]|nr:MAG: SGNH/GDSL hydrolase family protein [Deltaproteobacteria bacterium]